MSRVIQSRVIQKIRWAEAWKGVAQKPTKAQRKKKRQRAKGNSK